MKFTRLALPLFILLIAAIGLLAQDKPKDKAEPQPNNPSFVSPAARLAAAKTALIQNAGGSEVPYNVISSGIEGWGRFRLVESRSQADVIIEVTSPEEESSSVSTKTRVGPSGRTEDSTTTTRDLSNGAIKLVVLDGKTHIPLWSASERPKGGFRQRTRSDHLVEAASRLVTKLRERLDPPPPAPK
ncbi:MAG: hypothetical protein LAO06_07010 [Acidobacteriia bacterium]|nr:hypothetical protein [Terriglobia bacterium]